MSIVDTLLGARRRRLGLETEPESSIPTLLRNLAAPESSDDPAASANQSASGGESRRAVPAARVESFATVLDYVTEAQSQTAAQPPVQASAVSSASAPSVASAERFSAEIVSIRPAMSVEIAAAPAPLADATLVEDKSVEGVTDDNQDLVRDDSVVESVVPDYSDDDAGVNHDREQADIDGDTGPKMSETDPRMEAVMREQDSDDVLMAFVAEQRKTTVEPEASEAVEETDDSPVDAAGDYDDAEPHFAPISGVASRRMAEFAAFKSINQSIEEKLISFSEAVALSRLSVSSLQPLLAQFEADIQIADETERERDAMRIETAELRRMLDSLEHELVTKSAALSSAIDRNSELRGELDQRRLANQDLTSKLERLRKEQDRVANDAAAARAEIIRLNTAMERETFEKESYYQSRVEINNRLAKVQQAEAQARNKQLELQVQNENLMRSLPPLVAEQEKLRNEIRLSQREKADMQNRMLAAQDRIAQLESEVQTLQSYAASESFSSRTELETHKASVRTAEKAIADADARNNETLRQLRETEAAKAAAEARAASLQDELESVRRERADTAFKLSDVNLKYMTDLLSLDQQREQNKEFQYDIEALLAEKRRMAKFESLYKAVEGQISTLKEKLSLLADNLKDNVDPETLRRSIDIIGDLNPPHVPANSDKPQRPARKAGTN